MANNFIDVLTQANVIGTTFSGMTVRPFRPIYIFDSLCQERRWNLNTTPAKGDYLVFPVLSALSANTAALDPTTATIAASQKSTYTRRNVPLSLYGDHGVLDVLQLKPESYVDVISDNAFILADQGANSQNVLARAAMDLNKYSNEVSGTLSGTYHYYGSYTSTAGPLKAKTVRKVVADLKAANVPPYEDGFYRGIISPIQATQLRAETGNAAWRVPHAYTDPANIYRGEVGEFEGVRWIVSNEVAGAATGTISAYVMGRDFVGKAVGFDLRVKTKSTLDGAHENLLTIFWEALLGYKIVRRESGRIIETSNTTL